MLALSIKLILAHLIGDFLFHPDKWVKHKEKKKHKSKYLYWHILVHFGALLLVLQFNFSYWLGILFIIISHYIIDLTKLKLTSKINPQVLFFSDQALHILVIFGVVNIYFPYEVNIASIYSLNSIILLTSVIITTHVSSILIKILISKWKIKDESLNDAGKYIGMLERLFIFCFIILNYWEGIGFLLAAKSVFRFGDLSSKSKDRMLTEYILIGTLLSFGLAIATAMGYKYLLELASNIV